MPGLLDGMANVNRLAAKWLGYDRGGAAAARSAAQRMTRVAFVLKGYPRLSETFIAQEIAALEARGLDILIVSLRHPTDKAIHPVHRQIRAPLLYLPEYLYQEPRRVWRGWRAGAATARLSRGAARNSSRDLVRDRDAEPRPPLRPGAGAGGGIAGG